jgi:hypothetical protein
MRDLPRAFLYLLLFGLSLSDAWAQRARSKPPPYTRETLCADLNASIQKHPERLVMWLEDALVINESCAGAIVTAAIDAVNNNPGQVRVILDTALRVTPHRARQIQAAADSFSVPSAVAMKEPVEEIRRAVVMNAPASEPVFEIRRALSAKVEEPQPIEEIRRAVVPEKVVSQVTPAPASPRRRVRR